MLRSIAESLAGQNRLSAEEVNKVFSAFDYQGYISVNDASTLLDLLDTGRRAVYEMPSLVQADLNTTIATKPIKTVSTTTIQTKQVERSTNPFDDSPTLEPQTPAPAAPTFFQKVTDFFKPVTNFFASVRRFFGFN